METLASQNPEKVVGTKTEILVRYFSENIAAMEKPLQRPEKNTRFPPGHYLIQLMQKGRDVVDGSEQFR
jgi:hypothetical protein